MSESRDNAPLTEHGAEPPTEDDEGFLSRWSRRKALSRDGIEPPEPGPADDREPGASPGIDTPPVESAEERPDDAPPELPPLESLGEDSDYSAFLDARVSNDVRQQALRKLFRSPKFNIRDGLDDYDLDYTNPEPLGNLITAEMRHRIRVELERLARDEDSADAPDEVPTVAADADRLDEPETTPDAESDDERTEAS